MKARPLIMIWLGTKRGYLSDWLTQQWVRATGRRVELAKISWLNAPTGATRGIDPQFFDDYAARAGLEILSGDAPRGLVQDLTAVVGGPRIHPAVAAFTRRLPITTWIAGPNGRPFFGHSAAYWC